MLQKLNERIQGLVAWLVIIFIAITFTLFGVDYYLQSHQASNVAVKVNGEPLSKQTYEIHYRRARQQEDPSQLTVAADEALKKQILDNLIVNEVMLQAARKNGFEVNLDQANDAILHIPQFQADGRFSVARYQQALNAAMFTPESFQKEVQQGMVLNQQRFAFIGSAFALQDELERFVKLYWQTRDYDYLLIPVSLFRQEIKLSEEEIQQYYQQHKQEFISDEEVSIDYIRLSMKQVREKITVKEEEIKQYYEDNQSSFLLPAQWKVARILLPVPKNASVEKFREIEKKAQEIYQLIQKNPEQFETAATELSEDKALLAHTSEASWIVAGHTGLDKVLLPLTKPGEISIPVKTDNGYEIFKLLEYRLAKIKPFEEVKGEIKQQLTKELAQKKYSDALEKLSDLSYQSPDSLQPAAEALQLPIEYEKAFSRLGGHSNISKNKEVVNAAFSHDVLALGNNSEPIQLNSDTVVVFRVHKHTPPLQKPFSEVKSSIEKNLLLKKGREKAVNFGLNVVKWSKDLTEMEKLLTSHQLIWKEIAGASRETEAIPLINNLAFSMAKVGEYRGIPLQNGDYAMVHLKTIHWGEVSRMDNEQQDSIMQQIASSHGVMDYDLYLNSIMERTKIDKP